MANIVKKKMTLNQRPERRGRPARDWAIVTMKGSIVAAEKPKPGRGFRLFASAENIFTVNRVQCRVFSTGQICATGSSTVGGGIWPRGTANQFVFASGINIAGVIEPLAGKSDFFAQRDRSGLMVEPDEQDVHER